ncbi:ParA family protein [Niveibacterium sp. 24ML]|uniref:ParA family protein n=1 Tax=Niveibacterium sp. 24ML TaxID=2985512 RepID=UPI00227130AA|nr:ParA family protein [Niveibacterium sp. 24ML]MCX9156282.1 ParA family protein [Niveibacterium sp. 24ML]
MSVIAVVNRKGGSGKSTLATHVAGYLATRGCSVMLGDVDRQQSSRLWLGLRSPERAPIRGWTIDERNFARPPLGTEHVVLDTPGSFQGVGLMKVALYADAILLPATSSVFDRAAAADCIAELRTLPRVATGKCRIACVGMRIDARTRNAEALSAWAAGLEIDYLGTIRSAQAYCKFLEQGLSLFDFPPARVENYRHDWALLTAWIDEVLAFEAAPPRLLRPVASQAASAPENPLCASFLSRAGLSRGGA